MRLGAFPFPAKVPLCPSVAIADTSPGPDKTKVRDNQHPQRNFTRNQSQTHPLAIGPNPKICQLMDPTSQSPPTKKRKMASSTTTTSTTTAAVEQEHQFPLPPILTHPSSTPPILITQGAEGRLYKTTFLSPSIPCALKYRPPKPYRHPILDARLTKARLAFEAKVLERCRREGVPVPAVYAQNAAAGWIAVEWIEGAPVRVKINEWLGSRPKNEEEEREGANKDQGPLVELMRRIGSAIAGLHRTGVVHGDLTTSNMMLRPPKASSSEQTNGVTEEGEKAKLLEGEVVIIDFGLANQSQSDEDRATDLYVLERAFASTHPRAENLFEHLLESYKETFGKKGVSVLNKLEDVRMRGRKRSMIG
ncbi:kinase-like domain-containing protein [Sordaria brevicollis]|uniref:EKC/KEOPS complex subunit BUD32 n=1 Tax=Sordaria brevicollis TaxID=83679 RepID=A0AAE0PMQ7_SORBR|nr:kinase-like domain-containing protein [Sordaria brevicollis]